MNKDKKAQTNNHKWFGVIVLLVLCVVLVSAGVIFTQILPVSDTTENSSVNLEWNFTMEDSNPPNGVKLYWNGTNTTIYDESVVLMMNFDNRSALGENDTYVFDISGNDNNGTVNGGAVWNETVGKYNGAFKFDGVNDYIQMPDIESLQMEGKNFTFSAWINPINSVAGWQGVFGSPEFEAASLGLNNDKLRLTSFGSFDCPSSDLVVNLNEFNFISVSFDSTTTTNNVLYTVNGEESIVTCNNDFGVDRATSVIGYRKDSDYFNGTIDQAIIFNRSLTSNEIIEVYNSQLTKYNSTEWLFHSNQSISTNITGISYNYFLCISNSSDYENCTSEQIITRFPSSETITANFSNNIGYVKDDFYGINSGTDMISGFAAISTGGDNICDSTANATWHKEKILELRIKTIRVNMNPYYISSLNETSNQPIFNRSATCSGKTLYNITSKKDWVDFARENNLKLSWVISGTPEWLVNKTSGYCTLSGNNNTCPPSNYSLWGDMIYNFLDEIGCDADICSVEAWNEPEGVSSWLNDLVSTDPIKAIEYNKLANATYQAVTRFNSSMIIHAPITHVVGADSQNIISGFMTTFNDSSVYPNFRINFHYSSNEVDTTLVYDTILGNCTTHNFNCSNIYSNEWKSKNATEQNTTSLQNRWGIDIADVLLTTLNYAPNNISQAFYKYASSDIYNSNASDYPYVASMVSEPQLDDIIYPPYNVTKAFATYHPPLSTVYTSTSSQSAVKPLSTKKGNDNYITIINTDTEARNLTINDLPSDIEDLVDQETSTSYTVSSQSVNVGVLDSYGIVYLADNDNPPVITIVNPLSTKDETAQPTSFYITTDEDSTCTYSLDGGSNVTMSGSELIHTASQSTADGTHTVIYYCTDSLSNIGSASNTFTTSQIIGGGTTGGTLIGDIIATISEIPEKIVEEGESILDIINRRVEDVGDKINDVAPDTISELNLSGWDWILIMVGILSVIGIIVFSLTKWD